MRHGRARFKVIFTWRSRCTEGTRNHPAEERMTFSTMEGTVATADRGFASMDREKQREIASKGGRAAHNKGTAHEWTPTEAREAGRKGGMASRQKRIAEALPPPINPEFDDVL